MAITPCAIPTFRAAWYSTRLGWQLHIEHHANGVSHPNLIKGAVCEWRALTTWAGQEGLNAMRDAAGSANVQVRMSLVQHVALLVF